MGEFVLSNAFFHFLVPSKHIHRLENIETVWDSDEDFKIASCVAPQTRSLCHSNLESYHRPLAVWLTNLRPVKNKLRLISASRNFHGRLSVSAAYRGLFSA